MPPTGTNGVGLNAFAIDYGAVPAGTMLFNDIKLTCRGFQNAVVSLYNVSDNFDNLILLDTVFIHQIPEPMTLGLLGIGGLFLRRRK